MFRTALPFAVLLLFHAPAVAQEAGFRFQWTGAGGYEIVGAMSFDEDLLAAPFVYEGDVTCFEIEGRQEGRTVGRWALGMLTLETTWRLTFLPDLEAFAVYGEGWRMPQAWNMDGLGRNCGPDGFGFNIGSYAQDICIDGDLVTESQMPPATPFPVLRDDDVTFSPGACRDAMMLSGFSLPAAGAEAASR